MHRAMALSTNPHCDVVLAPMEGVVNAAMRRLLTALGGYSRCVTEFVRVTDVLLPERVFFRYCPELVHGGCTPAGTPVYVQLLGSDPAALAANARRAVALGAPGIDLNFGCPAKTVNNSMGGSILLRQPLLVATIVRIVRESVPSDIPVTAKIRLGYDNADALPEIAERIFQAGATELAVHARTRFDGYRPPAHWCKVASIYRNPNQRIVINGEIWTVADSLRAREESGCQHVMLGRGALAAPDLAQRINSNAIDATVMEWLDLVALVEEQFIACDQSSPRHIGNRTKQWLAYLRLTYPEANDLFQQLRTLHDAEAILSVFDHHRRALTGSSLVGSASGARIVCSLK